MIAGPPGAAAAGGRELPAGAATTGGALVSLVPAPQPDKAAMSAIRALQRAICATVPFDSPKPEL